MEDKQPTTIITNLPVLEDPIQEKGGRKLVDGWSPEYWSSLGEYVREGFNQDTLTGSPFNSAQQAFEFMSGIGDYRGRNSFFYNSQDLNKFQEEGFFKSFQCPNCLEELAVQLEGDDIPEEGIIDPEIPPNETEYQTKSFKPDEEKYVRKLWYNCRNHPEVSLMKTETWYE